jgi:archaetidylinositol phosphate synthase
VFLNGWMDLLDGALARRQGSDSMTGDLLDHVIDRYADIVVIAGLATGAEAYALGFLAVTGVLMTSYLGTQAQAVGLDRVYGGLVGRADRLAIIGVVTAASAVVREPLVGLSLVGWLLVFLAVVGHLTAMQRFYGSMGALE